MKMLTLGFLISFSAIMATAEAAVSRFHPNHLFIKMKEGQTLVKSPLIKSSKKIIGNLYLVKTSNPEALSKQVKTSTAVEYAEKDYFAGKSKMPKHEVLENSDLALKKLRSFDFVNFNDPYASRLWAFNASAGMNVSESYDILNGANLREVIVAVVDTGVDHTHEDLKDIMWSNSREIPGNRIDDDRNGYIDDIHGINTLVRDAQGRATMNTMASHWHGTHVAGTIAAKQNNGLGIAGVASNVKIMAIRTVPDDADEKDSDIVEAFVYAAVNGARIINCSFGKKVNEGGMVVRDVMNQIGQKYSTLVVAAAGNDRGNNDVSPKYPASFDSENLLVVASTTSYGNMSSFSNFGVRTVDVAAPGSDIYSTINGSKYGMASGTSMASPNTAGAAAMVLGAFPNLTAVQLKAILMKSVTPVAPFGTQVASGGRVNLKAALLLTNSLVRRY